MCPTSIRLVSLKADGRSSVPARRRPRPGSAAASGASVRHTNTRYTVPMIADCLTDAERADLRRIPAAEAAAELAAVAAESEAERAATLAYLQSQGWKTYEGMSVALCPICNEVGARFVARRLRDEHSPMIVRCTACAGKRQAS